MALNSKKNDRMTDVNNIVFDGIYTVVERHSVKDSNWIGTMTELTSALNKVVSKTQRKMLPGSPSALRLVINRVINRLRNRGIGVKFGRTTDHTRTRFVKFAR